MEIASRLCRYIRELIDKNIAEERKGSDDLSILAVGLGNREVTPDALGPYVADHLAVNRHVVKEYGKLCHGSGTCEYDQRYCAGSNGTDRNGKLEIVKGIVNETHPDIVIAVDALARAQQQKD